MSAPALISPVGVLRLHQHRRRIVANGRCMDIDASVPGAIAGDAVIFSIDGAAPEGMLYGVRAPSNGHVTFKVCNFTGGAVPPITSLPVSVITITL